jgi:hypothetical protein
LLDAERIVEFEGSKQDLPPPTINRRGCTMNQTIGRLLAAGNVAEVFEWGSRVVKLYRSPARKATAFRERPSTRL